MASFVETESSAQISFAILVATSRVLRRQTVADCFIHSFSCRIVGTAGSCSTDAVHSASSARSRLFVHL